MASFLYVKAQRSQQDPSATRCHAAHYVLSLGIGKHFANLPRPSIPPGLC
jgi:hypothetical protein